MSFSLSGLASGLDTNTIISQLMQLERIPYTKLESRKNAYNSELGIFRSINTKLNTLKTAADDLLLASTFQLRSATNSDESVLRATVAETAAETNFDIKVHQLATSQTMRSKVEFASEGTDLKGRTFKITKDGQTFEIELNLDKNDENLDKLMKDINAGNFGVKVSIIETNPGMKTVVFTSEKTGADNLIQVGAPPEPEETEEDSAPPETEPENPGAVDNRIYLDAAFMDIVEVNAGQNASLTVNGIAISSASNELNDVISGLSLTLLKSGDATVSVAKDVDKITDKVDAFVKAYNDVINTIRTNTAKGKSLQGDSTLRSLQDQLYNMFNRQVGGSSGFEYLYEIGLEIDKGIKTGSEMTGNIHFDKDKFKQALAQNPDGIHQLFAYEDPANKSSGIAEIFSETLRYWTRAGNGILTSKIEGHNSQLSFLNKQLEAMDLRITAKEEQLKKQFVAMETALAQLQNEQAWMSSQISSLGLY